LAGFLRISNTTSLKLGGSSHYFNFYVEWCIKKESSEKKRKKVPTVTQQFDVQQKVFRSDQLEMAQDKIEQRIDPCPTR